jgi:NAD+ kinase
VRFGLSVNMDVPDATRMARKALELLQGKEVVLETPIANRLKKTGVAVEEMDVDMLITIGGDGTILRALQQTRAPIFGINAGDLGFLTAVSEDEMEEGFENIFSGEYSIDTRIKMRTTVNKVRLPDAVNETVVHTAHIAKIRHFQVNVDGEMAVNVRADGIIVATPTGSTCYAMSVGAPLVDPRVHALVIAPMAAFKYSARPIVVPADSRITLKVVRAKECVAVVDGQTEHPLLGNEEIEFTASETSARFVTFSKGFYTRTREKLMGSLC